MSCDRMTSPASSGRRGSPTSTAAEVSSQEVSMPKTTSATTALALERHGVGYGARDDTARRTHGQARVPAGPRFPDQMRDDPDAVARQRAHLGLRPLYPDRNALRCQEKPGKARGGGADGHGADQALHD